MGFRQINRRLAVLAVFFLLSFTCQSKENDSVYLRKSLQQTFDQYFQTNIAERPKLFSRRYLLLNFLPIYGLDGDERKLRLINSAKSRFNLLDYYEIKEKKYFTDINNGMHVELIAKRIKNGKMTRIIVRYVAASSSQPSKAENEGEYELLIDSFETFPM